MNSTQYAHPPRIPLLSPQSVFDHRPVALHGKHEFGTDYYTGREARIPDQRLEEWTIIPKVNPLPGFTEVQKPIYEYPEVTGVFMRPPKLTNRQIARVSAATYEIESEQVLNRLAGMPPLQYSRQWDESYARYMY